MSFPETSASSHPYSALSLHDPDGLDNPDATATLADRTHQGQAETKNEVEPNKRSALS